MNKIKTAEQIIVPNLKNLQHKYPEEAETWKQFAKLYGIFGFDMDLDTMDVVEGMPILHVPALTPKDQLENMPFPEQFLAAITAINNGTSYNKYHLENVIQALEEAIPFVEERGFIGIGNIMHDALGLLKQEPVMVQQREIMRMLFWCCGSCGAPITEGDNFCRMCGRKMKWNDQKKIKKTNHVIRGAEE